jgi:hypothetical protein
MHPKGIKAACYISAGSWEKYRPDADDSPASVLGTSNGWPGEKWLDIHKRKIPKPIMRARIDICRRKGFDAIELRQRRRVPERDGVPAHRARPASVQRVPHERRSCPRTLRLPQERSRADPEAPALLRCRVERTVLPVSGCPALGRFVNAGKPVFNVGYKLDRSQFCDRANARNFNSLKKRLALDAWRRPCRGV